MKADEVLRRIPLEGGAAALAEEIGRSTGAPDRKEGSPALRSAIEAAFPGLPAGWTLEGCTDHPSATLRWMVPGLVPERVKAVLTPARNGVEVRTRIEVPGASYRKATLLRLLAFLAEVERALGGPVRPAAGRGEEAP